MLGGGNTLSTMLNPLERHSGAGRGVMHGMREVRWEMSHAVHSRLVRMKKETGGELTIWFDTCTMHSSYLAGVSGINLTLLNSTSSSSSSSSSVITISSPRSSSGSGDSTTRPPMGVSETRLLVQELAGELIGGICKIRFVEGVSATKLGRKRSPLDGSSWIGVG